MAKPKKNKRRKWIIIGLLLVLAAVIIAGWMKGKNKSDAIEVTTEKTTTRTIKQTVSASGKIFPETEVKISSDVSGEVVELYIEEGDSVVANQVLAKIDPDSYVSAVERGKASVNSAKAQVAISRSSIQSSIAQKEQIMAQLVNARNIHKRNGELKKEGVISLADFESSQANVDALQANLKSAEASILSAEESTKGAEFSVKSADAALKELQTSLNRTTIKAPTTGVISQLSIEAGERVVGTIQMAGTEIMRIANLNAMEVQVDVSENNILFVELGDSVDIEVDAYLDQVFKGTVTEIANSASNTGISAALTSDQVTNFIVKIRIDPKSYRSLINKVNKYPFRPGMSASVDIYTEKVEEVVSTPIQAISVREVPKDEDDPDGEKDIKEVAFIKQGDTVAMQFVKTGIQDDEFIEIISGLSSDQEVISGPYSAVAKELETGTEVKLKEDEKEGKKFKKK